MTLQYNSAITHPFTKDTSRIYCYFIQYEERVHKGENVLTVRCTDRQGNFWNVFLDNVWERHLELGDIERIKYEREYGEMI